LRKWHVQFGVAGALRYLPAIARFEQKKCI
jgi:hypothetical protein